jgi:hypothetical protein
LECCRSRDELWFVMENIDEIELKEEKKE